jgi:hypothetical protein
MDVIDNAAGSLSIRPRPPVLIVIAIAHALVCDNSSEFGWDGGEHAGRGIGGSLPAAL